MQLIARSGSLVWSPNYFDCHHNNLLNIIDKATPAFCLYMIFALFATQTCWICGGREFEFTEMHVSIDVELSENRNQLKATIRSQIIFY